MRRPILNAASSYLWGLLYTDGYDGGTAANASLDQSEKDLAILQLLQQRFPFTWLVRHVTGSTSFRPGSPFWRLTFPRVWRDLIHNLQKSPECVLAYIPPQHLNAFIRGVVDGDGSVVVNFNRRWNTRWFQVEFSGERSFLEALKEQLRVKGFRIGKVVTARTTCIMSANGRYGLALCNWMYKDAGDLCIQRKRAKYLQFQAAHEQTGRLYIPERDWERLMREYNA